MLARDYLNYADVKKKYRFKPVVLSHPMLMGLKQGQAKMSKSDPDSAIYMEDSAVSSALDCGLGLRHVHYSIHTFSLFLFVLLQHIDF